MDVTQLLRQHQLRITGARVAVLEQFVYSRHALTHADLEAALSAYDRVTLYRTLGTFLEQGILHKVPDDTGASAYAFVSPAAEAHLAATPVVHQHVHFKCHTCGQTECLPDVPVPAVQLPKGYVANTFEFLVQGRCANCQTR